MSFGKTLPLGLLAISCAATLPLGLIAAASTTTPTTAVQAGASAEALADIPAVALAAYQHAATRCPGLDWAVLAAIGKVESDHGRHDGAAINPLTGRAEPAIIGIPLDGRPGIAAIPTPPGGNQWHGDPTWDRAVGPMQFITTTWQTWGTDANGDRVADPHNIHDATTTAAHYLCAGRPELDDLDQAILRYNNSTQYLGDIKTWAARYSAPVALAGRPGLALSPEAQADLDAGLVDPRLVQLLDAISATYQIEISVLRTGHSQCVGGGDRTTRPSCSISNHWHGRAADITTVNGEAVHAGNTAARRLLEQLTTLTGPLQPTELGGPWSDIPNTFTDEGHQHHLHIGWD